MSKNKCKTLSIAVSTALAASYGGLVTANDLPKKQQATYLASSQYSESQLFTAYANSKYDYDDAKLLAKYWGKSNAYEAKLKIGRLLKAGDSSWVQSSLASAKKESNSQSFSDHDLFEAYANSKYSYDDAKLLAKYWGKSNTYEAKLKIGRLLKTDGARWVQSSLESAKKE